MPPVEQPRARLPSVGAMPSLRDLDAIHRLNAPTRAAATRRRRLRKAVAVLCLLTAAFILTPSSPSAGARVDDSGSANAGSVASTTGSLDPALTGRHLVALPAGTTVPPRATRVDIWNGQGRRLIRCAPALPTRETMPSMGTMTSATSTEGLTVALTEAQMATVAPILAGSRTSNTEIVVSSCT